MSTRPASAAAICIALALAVGALYAQTASFAFISMDDLNFLVQRPIVAGGLSWPGVSWAFTTVQPNWHPLTWLSHMADFSLFGMDAGRHHLVSAGLHALNAALCFLALRALTGALWPSALVAALFALHPLRVESVAWMAERKDVLSGTFWMLTLLAYAGYARRPSGGRYALVAAAFTAGLLSKTMLVSLPLVLLLLDAWPLRRWRGIGGHATAKVLLVEKLPLLGITSLAALLTVYTQQSVQGVKSLTAVPLDIRLLNAPIAAATYLRQTLWPSGLAAMYPHPALIGTTAAALLPAALGATLLLAAIAAVAWRQRHARPYLLVGWLWYLIALLPVVGLLQVGMQAHADRYTYLPMLGVYVMAAWSLRDLVAARPSLRLPATAAALLALAGFAAVTWRQIATWRDSQTVYERMLAVTVDNYYAHQVLGALLLARGERDAARQHLDAALAIRPQESFAHTQVGVLREAEGDRDGAAAAYETALGFNEVAYLPRARLASLRFKQARYADAVPHMQRVLEMTPDDVETRLNLGTALLQLGRDEDAAVQLTRVTELAPASAPAHNNLGVALAKLNRWQEAAAEFERVLAIDPTHHGAARSLQMVRAQIPQQ